MTGMDSFFWNWVTFICECKQKVDESCWHDFNYWNTLLTAGSQDVNCSGCSTMVSRLFLISSLGKLEALAKRGLLLSWYFQRARYTSRNMAEAPVKTVGFEMPTKHPWWPEIIAANQMIVSKSNQKKKQFEMKITCTGHQLLLVVTKKSCKCVVTFMCLKED